MKMDRLNYIRFILAASTALHFSAHNKASANAQLSITPATQLQFENTSPLATETSNVEPGSRILAAAYSSNQSVAANEPVTTGATPNDSHQEEPTIVVTGSYIRGTVAAGANLDIYDAAQIEQSGYATIQDFISALPQNFQGGGAFEDPSQGNLANSNAIGGSSVNLRGLGSDSTLVLVNGRRPPSSGLEANFTDISTIPQTAVERIEILPDGASALYGSDAVGGVINFVLRRDFDGAESRFRYGLAPEGDVEEIRAAQSVGRNWHSGHFIASYEFYRRDHLRYAERDFTSTYDLRKIGGEDRRITAASPGNILDPDTYLPAYAIPALTTGRPVTVADLKLGQVNYRDVSLYATLLPEQTRHSIFIAAEQDITSNTTIFVEGRYSDRKAIAIDEAPYSDLFVPASNAFFIDPFRRGFTIVSYSLDNEFGPVRLNSHVNSGNATGGTRVSFGDWQWETYASFSAERALNKYIDIDFDALNNALADSNRNTAFNPFGDGATNNRKTINELKQEIRRRTRTQLLDIKSIADGPLLSINDKDVSIAIGFEYLWSNLNSFYTSTRLSTSEQEIIRQRDLSRDVYATFAELYFPIVDSNSAIPFLHKLDLSLAARYDKYDDVGSTTNPKAGITWMPESYFTIKSSYGTAFRAPALIEKSTTNNSSNIYSLPDPGSPDGRSNMLLLNGTDPDLQSEKAKTWTIGIGIRPDELAGLSFEINYFRTKYENRIAALEGIFSALASDNLYPTLIIRNPSAEQLRVLCEDVAFEGNPQACVPGLVDVILDARTKNMSATIVKGLDFSLDWGRSYNLTNVSAGIAGTYLIDFSRQVTPESPTHDRVNTVNNPVDFRARSYVNISHSGIAATLTANYTDDYRNDIVIPNKKIKSHITIDLATSIKFDRMLRVNPSAPFGVNLSVINLFNNDPPSTDGGFAAYDSSNFDPLGRVISLELRASW